MSGICVRGRPGLSYQPLVEAGGGGFGGALANLGFRVDPGDYTVKIKLGDREMSKSLKVVDDPRVVFSAEDRAKKKAALAKLQPLIVQASLAQFTIVGCVPISTRLSKAGNARVLPSRPRM